MGRVACAQTNKSTMTDFALECAAFTLTLGFGGSDNESSSGASSSAEAGSIRCWGKGGNGQFGNEANVKVNAPVVVSNINTGVGGMLSLSIPGASATAPFSPTVQPGAGDMANMGSQASVPPMILRFPFA